MKTNISTKERILQSTFRLFAENSYTDTTLEEICELSEVSKGGLFHHFDSKMHLAIESISYGFTNLYSELEIKMENASKAEEKLETIIDVIFNLAREKPKLMLTMIEIFEKAMRTEEITDDLQWKQLFEKFLTYIENILIECKVSNAKIKTYLLAACLDGLAVQAMTLGNLDQVFELKEIKKELLNLFLPKKTKG